MDSYFKGSSKAAEESTRFFAWNCFISGAAAGLDGLGLELYIGFYTV